MKFTEQYIKMCEGAEAIQSRGEALRWSTTGIPPHNVGIVNIYNMEERGDGRKGNVFVALIGKEAHYFVAWTRYPNSDGVFWLPTQEQLQSILGPFSAEAKEEVVESVLPLHGFIYTLADYGCEGIESFLYEKSHGIAFGSKAWATSISELWLDYVMQEEYNKQWDAEKGVWVDESR